VGGLGGAVPEAVLPAGVVESVGELDAGLAACGPAGSGGGLGLLVRGRAAPVPGAVVGGHGVDAAGHRRSGGMEDVRGDAARRPLVQPGEGDEQAETALLGAHLGGVDVEEADRVGP
jgi:hypothetical protein